MIGGLERRGSRIDGGLGGPQNMDCHGMKLPKMAYIGYNHWRI